MAVDPSEFRTAAQAGHSVYEHYEVLMRVGVISFVSGVAGGTVAFFRTSRCREIPFRMMLYCYAAKVGSGCMASYLSLLVTPMFGIGTSTEAEQLIAILAAIMGADFIGLIMRRVLGEQHANHPWNGEERRGDIHSNEPGA